MPTDEANRVPREHRVLQRARALALAGPIAAFAAELVYYVARDAYGAAGTRADAAAVATFFAAFGAVSGLVARSPLHVVVGVNAGVAAGAAWRLADAPLGSLAGYGGAVVAAAVFGALFGLADWTRGHTGLGLAAGAISGLAFPFAWTATVTKLLTFPFGYRTSLALLVMGLIGGLLLIGMGALLAAGILVQTLLLVGSYDAARLFFVLMRERSRILPLKKPRPDAPAEGPPSDPPPPGAAGSAPSAPAPPPTAR